MTKCFFYGSDLVDWNAPDYSQWDGRLASAGRDAVALWALAMRAGVPPENCFLRLSGWGGVGAGPLSPFVKGETTRKHWREDWATAAQGKPGDTFIFGHSGHGYRNGYAIKSEEGVCMFDGLIPDYELDRLYASVPEGINVIVWYDCCHSGGLEKSLSHYGNAKFFNATKGAYKRPASKASVVCNVLILAACQPQQVAMDGPTNGAFTGSMLSLLDPVKSLPPWGDWANRNIEHMAKDQVLKVQTPMILTRGGGASLLGRLPFTE